MDGTDARQPAPAHHPSPVLDDPVEEGKRIMTICNACRYCEGHCAVFPAMEMRLAFAKADIDYLANLCHGCGSCYHHCQYAEPHEFEINVPRTFARVRAETYQDYAWPAALGTLYKRGGLWGALATAAGLAAFLIGSVIWVEPARLFADHGGDFYSVIPHNVMAGTFGAVGLFVLLALVMGFARFMKATGNGAAAVADGGSLALALHEAFTLKYQKGGGLGCAYPGEAPSQKRRVFHQLTFWGFLLCFAATSVGTVYHYVFGWIAPYDFLSLPVILGTLGGIGLLVGPAGLTWLRRQRDPVPHDAKQNGADHAFLALLFLTSLTGLALLFLRSTPAMGLLLAVHLGVVMGLFLTLPYGKFVHAVYRIAALLRYARERRSGRTPAAADS